VQLVLQPGPKRKKRGLWKVASSGNGLGSNSEKKSAGENEIKQEGMRTREGSPSENSLLDMKREICSTFP